MNSLRQSIKELTATRKKVQTLERETLSILANQLLELAGTSQIVGLVVNTYHPDNWSGGSEMFYITDVSVQGAENNSTTTEQARKALTANAQVNALLQAGASAKLGVQSFCIGEINSAGNRAVRVPIT